MPTSNERKHVIPAGGDASFSRATIFEDFGNSIHDVIPVANATERAQVVSNLVAAGQGPTAANPLVVIRADAPGLRRVEYTYDGSVWLPASGVLDFASKAAADSWGAANGGYLSDGDRARIAGIEYMWQGAWRRASLSLAARSAGGVVSSSTPTTVLTLNLPSDAPSGNYLVTYTVSSDATSVNSRFHQVTWAGTQITDWLNDYVSNVTGGQQVSDTILKTAHPGGAAEVKLTIQINASGAIYRMARVTVTYVGAS